jgi:PAS domain-containing protein
LRSFQFLLHRAALRQARDKLEIEVAERTQQANLLNLTHDSIFVRDPSDRITYWNRGAGGVVRMVAGESSRTALARPAADRLPCAARRHRVELLQSGRWEGELTHTKADGTTVVVSSR